MDPINKNKKMLAIKNFLLLLFFFPEMKNKTLKVTIPIKNE